MADRMPAIFFGHGNPMNALADNEWTRGWNALAHTLPRPEAILCVSAHWYIPAISVTAMDRPRTIHDFGGFPRELFDFQYPAPGSPALAELVRGLLSDDVVLDTKSWGLDHGTWSVLHHVFPKADVPIVQLSIDETRDAAWHFDLAKRLAPLRDEGVLIVGSGNLIHNLHTYAWGRHDVEPFDWALRFEATARGIMESGDFTALIDYERMGRDAHLAAPTPDHFLPSLYVLAQYADGDAVTFPVEGFDGGSISMTAVKVG